jgi:hypothetical protein
MANKDMQYGMILIIISVFFLISGLDLLEHTWFNTGLSSLIAFVTVAIGAYLLGQNNK